LKPSGGLAIKLKIKVNSIRTKLILAIFESAGLASICMIFLGILFIIASSSLSFSLFFHEHFFEFVLLFFCIFVILTIVFFLHLIRNSLHYLEEITTTLQVISHGDFDVHIPVKTSDELGKMAGTVNVMAYKLKEAIEEERRLEKTKNDLITHISHDLRTPLTSTLGYLELIRNMTPDQESNLWRYISIAHGKCKDLKILIDHLFEYSKLHNSRMTINQVRVSIGELLEQVIMGFIPALKEAHMMYRLFFINEKLMVTVDPMLLTRVFNNLIDNAINYGKDGEYLDIELIKDDQEAVIRIINYGNPISDADLPYLFNQFYQADQPRLARNHHSGLGLAIVKRVMEIHHGTVEALSDHDKTIFEVRLKLCK